MDHRTSHTKIFMSCKRTWSPPSIGSSSHQGKDFLSLSWRQEDHRQLHPQSVRQTTAPGASRVTYRTFGTNRVTMFNCEADLFFCVIDGYSFSPLSPKTLLHIA